MRGYLWQRLEEEIEEEFEVLSGSVIDERWLSRSAFEDRRILSEERTAAALRIGEEWARRLVTAAKSRGGKAAAEARQSRLTPTQIVLAERRAARKRRRSA